MKLPTSCRVSGRCSESRQSWKRYSPAGSSLDGHLIGSIGEVLAAYHYGLELLPASAQRHDATAQDVCMVQIKAMQGTGHVALRSEPEHLIILLIHSESGEAQEVYNGPGALVWECCGRMASNGSRPIGVKAKKPGGTGA